MGRNAITLVKRNASGHEYWDARWHDHDAGKRPSKTLGRCDQMSERQARKIVAQMEVEFGQDPRSRSPATVPTLAEWMELFIQRKEADGRKAKTLADYRAVQRLLLRHFGTEKRLNEINRFDLQQFRLRLAKHELHGALKPTNKRRANAVSITKYMRLVSAVFMAAFDDELISRNPARKMGLQQSPASAWQKIEGEQFWKLYNVAPANLKPLLALCRLAALRHSDAVALRWSNVRLDEGVLVFRPIKVERYAKTDARVPISSELRAILMELREKTKPGPEDTIVSGGALIGLRYAVLKRLCKKAGIAPWRKPLHTLRKSCIDDWVKVAPPNVVMHWATHSSLSTTMRFYSKVSKGDEALGQQSLLPPPEVSTDYSAAGNSTQPAPSDANESANSETPANQGSAKVPTPPTKDRPATAA